MWGGCVERVDYGRALSDGGLSGRVAGWNGHGLLCRLYALCGMVDRASQGGRGGRESDCILSGSNADELQKFPRPKIDRVA